MAELERVGVRAVIEGLTPYLTGMAQMERATGGVGRTSDTLASQFKRAALAGVGLAAGFTGFQAITRAFDFARDATIGFNAQLEQATVAFTTMTGSADIAGRTLDQLKEFAKATPFQFPDLLEASQRLMAMGTSANDLIPTLEILGNISAGVGREKLPQLILAFGQVQAATRLTGMELRQFTEAGVPLLEGLAQHFGITTAEAKKMVEEGTVGFEAVRSVLASLSAEGGKFGGLMQKQSQTFGGAMSNIMDSLRFAMAEGFAPFFEVIRKGTVDFANFLMSEDFKKWMDTVVQGAKDAKQFMGEFLGLIKDSIQWVQDHAAAQLALAAALSLVAARAVLAAGATGLSLVLSILGPLTAGVITLTQAVRVFGLEGLIVFSGIGAGASVMAVVATAALASVGLAAFVLVTNFNGARDNLVMIMSSIAAGFDIMVGNIAKAFFDLGAGILRFLADLAGKIGTFLGRIPFVGDEIRNAMAGMQDFLLDGSAALGDLGEAALKAGQNAARGAIEWGNAHIEVKEAIDGTLASQLKFEKEMKRQIAAMRHAGASFVLPPGAGAIGADGGGGGGRGGLGRIGTERERSILTLEKLMEEAFPKAVVDKFKERFIESFDEITPAAMAIIEDWGRQYTEFTSDSGELLKQIVERGTLGSEESVRHLNAIIAAWELLPPDLQVGLDLVKDKLADVLTEYSLTTDGVVDMAARAKTAILKIADEMDTELEAIANSMVANWKAALNLGKRFPFSVPGVSTSAGPVGYVGPLGPPDMVALPVGPHGGATSPAVTSINVTANYSNPQTPQSLRYDLEAMMLSTGR